MHTFNLTTEEVQDLFAGAITYYKMTGRSHVAKELVRVIERETGSTPLTDMMHLAVDHLEVRA